MCVFKPGDRVVCIKSDYGREGMEFTVAAFCEAGQCPPDYPKNVAPKERDAVQLNELRWVNEPLGDAWAWGYPASCFRKVQKRNDRLTLEAFFTVPGGFEEPRRAKEKQPTKEKAQ